MLVPDAPEFAGTGGPVRSFQFIRMLATLADVTILVFAEQQSEKAESQSDLELLREAGYPEPSISVDHGQFHLTIWTTHEGKQS